MKIQLDTSAKTIKIENNINLFELWSNLNKILPNEEWKQFTLLSDARLVYWDDPIYIKPIYRHYYEQPWYYCSSQTGQSLGMSESKGINKTAEWKNPNNETNYSLKAGTYNIEL